MKMQPSGVIDSSDLPQELCVKPLVLVGLSGLDTVNNAIHKSIWDTFASNRRADRVPILFKVIDNAHEFPVVKPKRNSYEWYIPKGILKRNWMNKYLNEVPAVMVIFYDLDWNDIQWNEKMIECASRVQSMRAALEGRNSRITVVLLQNSAPPAGDDIIASERATALCSSCDLNAKSLFVLPHVDHMQGYAVRLESAFYDQGQNFYHMEAKNIKSHREHLNKTAHQYLFVRHQFKMGFMNELRQDNHTAHKHYVHAYNNLSEIRIVDTNANEIRTIAGYINYKLCRLMFTLNLPRDAISQFRSHVDRFRNRIGFKELSFEHNAWLSKQYNMFGDIFDEAVRQGLPAVQTQHPGLYYQQAAQFAILRRKQCAELCSNVVSYPFPDPLEGMSNLEFYGQRPWRPGKLSAEPPDPYLENNGIVALQYVEKQINHSVIIITLYGLAISQYKTYRCPRTRRHLVVQMAEEYFSAKDYGKALTLFTHMLWDYRTEQWWGIIKNILLKALECAFLTVNVQDYIALSFETLSSYIDLPDDHKKKIYNNLKRVLNKQIPKASKDLPADLAGQASILWQKLLATKSLALQIDLGTVVCCIDAKCKFLSHEYQADENITVEVYIKSLCRYPVEISKILLHVTTPGFQGKIPVDIQTSDYSFLTLNPMEIKMFSVNFPPDPNDVGQQIQIGSVHVLINSPDLMVDLKFAGTGNDSHNAYPELQHFCPSPHNMPDFDNIKPLLRTSLIPRHSKLEIEFHHSNPSLLGEWYEITVKIINKEMHVIEDIKLNFTLADDDGLGGAEFSAKRSFEVEPLPLCIKLEKLKRSAEIEIKFYMRAQKVGERKIHCAVSFLLVSEKPIASLKEASFQVTTIKPFDISTKFLSTLFENVDKFYVQEEIVVMPIVSCLSPWPIVIEDTSLEFSGIFENVNKTVKSQMKGLELKTQECGTELFLANPRNKSEKYTEIGKYNVKWRRVNGFSSNTEIILTGLPIEWIPLDMKLTLPEHGFVRTPLVITYRFINKSLQLIQLDLNVEGSEAFMYAGYKQSQTYILPESEKLIEYNLYPLIAGSVALPKLLLSIPENSTDGPSLRQEHLDSLIERAVPKYLFIMPQMKGSPKITY